MGGHKAKTCDVCGKPIETDKAYLIGMSRERWTRCECDCERKKREASEARERDRERERRRVIRTFPSDAYGAMVFNGAARSDVLVKAWRFAEGFELIRPTGCGLLLHGCSGGGKTFAATCIANKVGRKTDKQGRYKYNVLFLSVPELCKPGRWDNDPTERIKSLDLLILDDMGAERGTEYAQDTLFRAVDAAYGAGVPMIVTTNCESFEGRTWSRVLDRCQAVKVNGICRNGGGLETVREVIGV